MIVLALDHLRRIADAAEAAYPEECCGLLVGRRDNAGRVVLERVAPSPNVAEGDRRRRFEVDPALRLALMRELRDGPAEIVGHYHSHPDGAPRPSDHDLARAWEPELVWLIAAVAGGQAVQTAAWEIRSEGGGARPLEIRVDAGGAP